VGYARTEGR
jgi:hypothetical protein